MARRKRTSDKEVIKKIEEELADSMTGNQFQPIKRQLRINQFKWTDNQKEFFYYFLNLLTYIAERQLLKIFHLIKNYHLAK